MNDDDTGGTIDTFVEVTGVLVSPTGMPRMPRPGRARDPDRTATELPGFGRVGYLAVSDAELAVFKTTKIGMRPGPKGEPLTRVPLSELISAELDERRVVAFLKLGFADDVMWTLQIARLHRAAAQQVLTHLRPFAG